MTRHLLLIAVGPVQGWIEEARRMRDLWFGSYALSELSRSAASALATRGRLVFPALEGDALVPNLDDIDDQEREPRAAVANKVLAVVEGDPESAARAARDAVLSLWRTKAEAVRRYYRDTLIAGGTDRVWWEQVETFLEVSAAWAPIPTDAAYGAARQKVEAELAARKGLRDFSGWNEHRPGVPKSSLDGARETVLRKPSGRDARTARALKLKDGEQLDAIGLIKRGGIPSAEQFIPVANVALVRWIERAKARRPAAVEALCRALDERESPRVRRTHPCGAVFPFDAEVLLESRWPEVKWDTNTTEAELEELVGPILASMPDPHPYVACIVADGDHMGNALNALAGGHAAQQRHEAFSRELTKFPREARVVVETERPGLLCFSGGDDVLAFIGVTDALDCARRLREVFERAVSPLCDDPRPSLSVGIGIGHLMDGLASLLDLARRAEKLAKQRRNSLAIITDKRSGSEERWTDLWDSKPVDRLVAAREALGTVISHKKVYEVRATLRRFPRPHELASAGADPTHARPASARLELEPFAAVLGHEVARVLARSDVGSREEPLTPAEVGLDLGTAERTYRDLWLEVDRWVSRFLIAGLFLDAAQSLEDRR
ncbi:type III-B CRISPR-associated protein Cas10/Cmr2 [Myxococcota bacterium]|nr:type III-B CRISPR-associated protein Cas10/Cmr2 [Myxococcota bacterium]